MTSSNSAREAILRAVTQGEASRAHAHRGQASAQVQSAGIAAEARALLEASDAVRPRLPLPGVVDSFAQRLSGPKLVGASLDRVSSLADVPAAVARHLAAKGKPPQITLQPAADLTTLDWETAGLRRGSEVDGAVIVGLASWGIAETASLVFHSAPDMPILYNFLGDLHIVAVRADSIVAYLEDYAAAARAAGDPAPRNVCLVTGASGTTDIEGSLVRGAHGPRELHVVIVG